MKRQETDRKELAQARIVTDQPLAVSSPKVNPRRQRSRAIVYLFVGLFQLTSYGQLTRLYDENREWKKEIQAFTYPDLNLMVDTSKKVYDIEGNLLFNPPNPRPVILFELWKKEILVISILSDEYVSGWQDYVIPKGKIVLIDLKNGFPKYSATLIECFISEIDLVHLNITCTDYRKNNPEVNSLIRVD